MRDCCNHCNGFFGGIGIGRMSDFCGSSQCGVTAAMETCRCGCRRQCHNHNHNHNSCGCANRERSGCGCHDDYDNGYTTTCGCD